MGVCFLRKKSLGQIKRNDPKNDDMDSLCQCKEYHPHAIPHTLLKSIMSNEESKFTISRGISFHGNNMILYYFNF